VFPQRGTPIKLRGDTNVGQFQKLLFTAKETKTEILNSWLNNRKRVKMAPSKCEMGWDPLG